MFKKKLFLLLFWTLFVFVLIATPLPEYNGDVETLYDKVAHVFLFGIFVFLLAMVLVEKYKKRRIALLLSFFGGVFYSTLCEFIQSFVPGRDVSKYDLIAGILGSFLFFIFAFFLIKKRKPRLLLHICCVGCGVYISRVLKQDYDVTLYFYNPNIYPPAEYIKRLEEAKKIAKKFKLKLIVGEYDHEKWLQKARGHEYDPEKGERCLICYHDRLQNTAEIARAKGFSHFTTTLTTSPHKLATEIFRIGQELAQEYNLEFLAQDFKKQDGFKKAAQLSRELDLYRQDYCGCEFSRR